MDYEDQKKFVECDRGWSISFGETPVDLLYLLCVLLSLTKQNKTKKGPASPASPWHGRNPAPTSTSTNLRFRFQFQFQFRNLPLAAWSPTRTWPWTAPFTRRPSLSWWTTCPAHSLAAASCSRSRGRPVAETPTSSWMRSASSWATVSPSLTILWAPRTTMKRHVSHMYLYTLTHTNTNR